MKKVLALILAVMYLSTSNGVVLTTHFCMGKKPVKKCVCSKEDNDCCKDEVKVLKIENAHKGSFAAQIHPGISDLVIHTFPHEKVSAVLPVLFSTPFISEPLRPRGIPIFLLNRSFLI